MRSESSPNRPQTDLELERTISASLKSQHVPSLCNVKVEARSGIVVLRGQVNSFYAKQLFSHSAQRLVGRAHVVDEVSVITPTTFRDPLRLRQSAAAGVALLVAVVLTGCSKQEPRRLAVYPVTGQVSFEGRPAAGAWVVFHPKGETPNLPEPRAIVDGQGNFTLGTYEPQDGAPSGEYAVTLELRPVVNTNGDVELGPNVLPPKYSSAQTTTVVAKVPEGPTTVPIKIVR